MNEGRRVEAVRLSPEPQGRRHHRGRNPEGHFLRVDNAPGLGIPVGSNGFVRPRENGRPVLERKAPDLLGSSFTNL